MWPDEVDEIITCDQVVALAYATPAAGVVVTPLTNMGLRDRISHTLTSVNTSVGMVMKLERIRANPQVALAFHTRKHGFSSRPEYVLVQGRASFEWPPPPDYVSSIREDWERFAGRASFGPVWDRWLRVLMWRVGIEVAVERVVVWPDLACIGLPVVHGPALPKPPSPQAIPGKGAASRRDRPCREKGSTPPNQLLGWVDTDGFPLVVPVRAMSSDPRGIVLQPPAGLVPPGGRRAGFTAHAFARYTYGQTLRKHTGWLQADDGAVTYAPHTETGYRFPASSVLFRVVAGAGSRWGLHKAHGCDLFRELDAADHG